MHAHTYVNSCELSVCGHRPQAAISQSDLARVQSELQRIEDKYCPAYDDASCYRNQGECLDFSKYSYAALCEAGQCKVPTTRCQAGECKVLEPRFP